MMLGSAASARRRSSSAIVRVAAAELPDNRVYQRSSGVATLSLSGTYTGTASAVSARVISVDTSAEVVGWTAISAPGVMPLAWWMFAEASGNRASSGGSLDVLVPSASAPTKVAGPSGKDAVNFDKASTQQFSLAESGMSSGFPGRSTVTNDSVTVGAWVRIDAETAGDGGILSKATNYQLVIEGSAVQFRIHSSTDTVVFSADAQTYTAGVWRHYVGRYTQSSGEVALFSNGVKQTVATSATRKVGTAGFLLGASPFKANFDGALAEVFVYPSALTDSQIADIYTSGLGSSGNGLWSGTLTVPQGGWYKLQYRLSGDPTAVHTAINKFGIGDIWMMAGEGQQARMSTLVNVPPAPDSKTVYFISGTTWTSPGVTAGTGGNGGIKFLNLMRQATNVPQALIQVSVEGTAITDWEVGDAAYNTAVGRLTAVVNLSGILWHQGGTGIGVVTKANYKTRLAALRTGLTSAAVTVQRFGLYPLMQRTNAADTDAATHEIRQAHYEYLFENPAVINLGWRPDVLMGDDIYQSAIGSEQIAEEYAHALLYQMGTETVGNLGPTITAASLSGRMLTLTVQHRSGTALKTNTGLAPTGFQVFPRNAAHSDASALTISGITLNPGSIDIELAADPGGSVDIYYQYGRFDASSPVFDNTVFAGTTVGNALQPLMMPVQTSLEVGTLSSPAVKLDGLTGHIRYGQTDNWWLPDADWTMGIWARVDDPAGTVAQHLISAGNYAVVQSFNLLIHEATQTGTGRAGAIEFNIRGAGATAISALGLANPANLDTNWRLWVVERVKATETLNVYSVPVNGVRTLQATVSSTDLGAVTPTTNAALGTRAPPSSTSGRWFPGGIWEVFRLNALLSSADMTALANGADIIGTLGKPAILRNRFTSLATPVLNSGTGNPVNATINGGVIETEGPLFSVQTNAVQFNEAGMIYTMPNSSSFITPGNTDWTIGFMVSLDENAGTVGQYLWSTGSFSSNSLNIFLWETGSANSDKFGVSLDDGVGSQNVDIISINPITPTLNGGYYLWTIERDISTTRINIYYTPVNGVRVLLHSHLPAGVLGQITPATAVMTIGGRNALATPANRYFGGKMHLAFQMDGKLTQTQNQDIARGRDLMTTLGLSPKWYHKFTTTAATLTDLSGNGNTATLSGGTAVVVVGPTFTPNG